MSRKFESILLVDDTEIEHEVMRYLLEDYGQPVTLHSAYDGVEALELLNKLDRLPDIIFLDINMPRMNGHEFLEAYSQREPSDIPIVVMLTSSEQDIDKERCKAYSFVKDYLLKPIELEQLKTLVLLLG